ncbi:RsfA family transcriptional regulator [Virgibacillus sp. YIM 98842]|uniref:RsfA family transcriptional regulator n=1 Tax=Virgibacillus sp. YIM 98842 TaxID=2663533 RepID=UPI0013DBB420|nr:RsfA family transcriptional regulator [Virgibacillus sp. YIM 98842]
MVKVRQDAWSHEDDLLLAETVLRHIREGSTQLNAFEEVGDKLNRTSAACGFRWNAEVRNKYDSAIDLAKRQRKEKKRAMAKNMKKARKPVISLQQNYTNQLEAVGHTAAEKGANENITLETVIHFLQGLQKDYYASNQSKAALEQSENEKEKLEEQVTMLEKKLNETKKQLDTIREDYEAFIQIMDRARKMAVLEDNGATSAPAFRMDKNGNLQQIAQGSN